MGTEIVRADAHDEAAVAAALVGAYGAVNAVSLYVERGRDSFHTMHVVAAARIARLARQADVKRLVHVSGIGADPTASSTYIRARGAGEIAVQQAFPGATLIRPAVMFGLDDGFLVTLMRLIRTLPLYPMFGSGQTRLQPVFVDDVAEAVARILDETVGAARPCYELGGPRVYTYAELLWTVAERIGARVRLVPIPFALWEALAWAAEFVPGAPLARNQVALMRRDTIASGDLPGLLDLKIDATAIEAIVPATESRRGELHH